MARSGMQCPSCGTAVGHCDRFCRHCGLSLANNECALEYRYITALFSDLSRYTDLSSRLDPEELKSIMDAIFLESSRIILSYGGIIEKFIGDAVVALFGVHCIHEDDIIRAIHAAREIHTFVEGMSDVPFCERLSMHTGIHTGTVIFDQQRAAGHSHGVIGMPINIASRLSSLASPGEILIGNTMQYEAGRFFHINYMGTRKLKGLPDPMAVYRVDSVRQVPVSVHRQGFCNAVLVGREDSLLKLMEAYSKAWDGRMSMLILSGDAGVGKSRLVLEFIQALPPETGFVLVQCQDHMKDTPYLPAISMIRQMIADLDRGKGGEGTGRELDGLMTDPRHVFHIRSLLGTGQADKKIVHDIWKTDIFEAVSALVHQCTKNRVMVVCIEDIHWADASTVELLETLIPDDDQDGCCLFIVTSRTANLINPCRNRIHLEELPRDESGVLFRNIFKDEKIQEEIIDAFYRSTGGNPFYIEEFISYLREKGIEPFSWNGAEHEGAVPATIQGLIAARMENIGYDAKHLLQAASVIGMIFSKSLLGRILSDDRGMDTILLKLEQTGFIASHGPDEYMFRHALTREVALMTLLKRSRNEFHRRIGTCLEESSLGRKHDCGIIAYHLFHAREFDRAYPYCLEAAGMCQVEGSWIEASAHFRMSRECLIRSNHIQNRTEMITGVLEGIWSCSRIFDPDQAVQALEELVGYYAQEGNRNQEIFSKIRLINLYSQKGLFAKALGIFEEVISSAGDNDLLIAAAKTAIAYTYTYLGRPIQALDYLEEARGGLDPSDRFLLSVNYLTTLAACVWKGDIPNALAWHAITKEQSAPYMDLNLMSRIWLGYILFLKGDIVEGQRIFDETREKELKMGCLAGGFSYLRIQSSIYLRSRYSGDLVSACEELAALENRAGEGSSPSELILLYRAWIALEQGRFEETRRLMEDAVPVFEQGIANRVPYALNALAEALYMLRDYAGSVRVAEHCITWNTENGNLDQLIWAWRILGMAQMKLDNPDDARKSLFSASSLAVKGRMKPHMAWTLASWGDFHNAEGRISRARGCYRRAACIWKTMGSAYQAAKIEKRLSLIVNDL